MVLSAVGIAAEDFVCTGEVGIDLDVVLIADHSIALGVELIVLKLTVNR